MRCPFCSHTDTAVKDSRVQDEAIRRRRLCEGCGARFTTYERIQLKDIYVNKRNGDRVMFDRDKLSRSIERAMHKRPSLKQSQIEHIVSSIIRQIETFGTQEVTTQEIGDMVLTALLHLDQMAYIRFASVYKKFESIEDWFTFIKAIPKTLNEEHSHA